MATSNPPGHRVDTAAPTSATLADGREILFFDDDPARAAQRAQAPIHDTRDLPVHDVNAQMRRDPLTGEWISYATHRMNRTFMPAAADNPLAPTLPGGVATEVPAADYDVVVFENRFPSFSDHNAHAAELPPHVDGTALWEQRPAAGRCEVICFSPSAERSFSSLGRRRIRTIIDAWAHRTSALESRPDIAHVFPFENRGAEIGVTLQHPHGQIYGYPFLPPRIRALTEHARAHREAHGSDLWQDMIDAELAAGHRILQQTEHFLVLVPAAARWPVELMVLPLRHVPTLADLDSAERADLAELLPTVYAAMDAFFPGVDRTPYIAAWNQAPVAPELRDTVRLHLHLFSLMRSPHRMKFLAGSESAMGAWVNDTTPEHIAQRFRTIWPAAELTAAALDLFTNEFFADAATASQPHGVWQAPGRVNLLGDHVDYAAGISIPCALPMVTIAALAPRTDDRIVVASRQPDGTVLRDSIDLADVGPGSPSTWLGYVAGTIWALAEHFPEVSQGWSIALTSDVPVGAGLSSSAALECSVGIAVVETVLGRAVTEDERALIAAASMRAEQEVVGASTGGLDQRTSLFASLDEALVIDFSTDSTGAEGITRVPFDDPELRVLIADTRAPHALNDGQYASRRAVIDDLVRLGGYSSFTAISSILQRDCDGDITDAGRVPEDLGSTVTKLCRLVAQERDLPEDVVRRRLWHVYSETARTALGARFLSQRDYRGFGEVMQHSHTSLRDLYEVSTEELDCAQSAAMAHGAWGARMTGGGFGGSIVAIVPADSCDDVEAAVVTAARDAGFPEPHCWWITPAEPAHRTQ